ncbi:hypothetical protein [Sinorhizobium medicae]|uniref:hypothetical protein n=1 Tax=Sinorhizobium medicae TaxID=110321 RepID=UPI001F35337B|nr:hypothetical protein [Sinorhizobium medicae]
MRGPAGSFSLAHTLPFLPQQQTLGGTFRLRSLTTRQLGAGKNRGSNQKTTPTWTSPEAYAVKFTASLFLGRGEKGDIKALKAFPINPVSSSPKATNKYRNFAITALEAQRNAARAE